MQTEVRFIVLAQGHCTCGRENCIGSVFYTTYDEEADYSDHKIISVVDSVEAAVAAIEKETGAKYYQTIGREF